MSNQSETRSAFVGFFGTLPGIITAIAGLITALVAAGLIGSAVGGSGSQEPVPSVEVSSPATDVQDVEVPDVIGLFVDDAITQLEARDLRWVVTPEASDVAEQGSVVAQHPPGGTWVETGSYIELWEAIPPADIL